MVSCRLANHDDDLFARTHYCSPTDIRSKMRNFGLFWRRIFFLKVFYILWFHFRLPRFKVMYSNGAEVFILWQYIETFRPLTINSYSPSMYIPRECSPLQEPGKSFSFIQSESYVNATLTIRWWGTRLLRRWLFMICTTVRLFIQSRVVAQHPSFGVAGTSTLKRLQNRLAGLIYNGNEFL